MSESWPLKDEASRGWHRRMVCVLAVLLLIAHHDFWWWDSGALVLGFVPISLAYHMGFSMAAAGLWLYAIFYAWPVDLERWADASEGVGDAEAGRAADAGAEAAVAGERGGGVAAGGGRGGEGR